MKLPALTEGRLIKRYKRFLADVELADGSVITVHCPNSGSMKGCAVPGGRVLLSRSANPDRAYAHTWELAEAGGGWIGINTGLPNRLVREAIENGTVPELQGYDSIRPEVPYGERSTSLVPVLGSDGRREPGGRREKEADRSCLRPRR